MGTFRTYIRELGLTLKLAGPIMAGQVGQMLMALVDTVMVGKVGVIPLAGAAFALALVNVAFVFGIGILTSVGLFTSRAHGSGDESEKITILRSASWLAIGVGAILGALLSLIQPALGLFNQPADVLSEAKPFLSILGWSLVPALLFMSAKIFGESVSRPFVPMLMMYVGLALNVVLNWILIFGNLGAPALGLVGAGWGTLIGRVVTAAGTIWYCLRICRAPLSALLPFGVRLATIRSLVQIGLPVGCQYLSEVGAFAFAAILIGWISAPALAAHQIAITCAGTTFMFPLGVSQAVSIRIGQAVGSGLNSLIRTLFTGGLTISFLMMSVSALLFAVIGRPIACAFNTNPAVVEVASTLLIIAGVFQIADGVQVTAMGALRGIADVRIPMLLAIAFYWIIAIPVGYSLAFFGRLGAAGIWMGLALGLFLAAITLSIRFFQITKSVGAMRNEGALGIQDRP
jgi:multidrug resistance protein, MATE family